MVAINSVQFLDGQGLEVSFFEDHEQTEKAGLMKAIVLSRTIVPEEYEELEVLLRDIIDKGLLAIRSPAKTLNPRDRIRRGLPAEVEDEPDDDETGN